ncbi:MAG: energy transducer TonB [Bacteroidia bacterium]|jgi:hypothetical protein|nr:energy transducer TonB [Bacteroidia bacterium]
MNPIQLAVLLILLLAFASKSRAGSGKETHKNNDIRANIAAQFKLHPEEAERLKNKTVRFYFTVDAGGRVQQVVAAEADPYLKSLLEAHFRNFSLKGFPENTGGRVDVNFILN